MARNLLIYKAEHLRKINSMRRANSQPDIESVPIPTRGEVLFTTAAEMHNEPASCYNCIFYNSGDSCQLIGPRVRVRRFIYPRTPTADSKPIEYWPCCGMHQHGEPNFGPPRFLAANDPGSIDLLWINAPSTGLEYSGANCGGENGGDDCDHYCTPTGDKRDEPSGFCRVLQSQVMNGDVCASWRDDDQLSWDKAQAILKERSDD